MYYQLGMFVLIGRIRQENMSCPKGHKYDVKWFYYFVHFYKLFAAIVKAELEQEFDTAGRSILRSLLANDITSVRCQCPSPGFHWLDNGKNGSHPYSIPIKQPIKHPQALLMSIALSDIVGVLRYNSFCGASQSACKLLTWHPCCVSNLVQTVD